MSLLFDMLSKFGTAFLLRSKYFLISWLQSLPAVILKPKKIKCIQTQSISVGRYRFKVVEFSSVAQSCPTLCDSMDCSTVRQASQSITNSQSLLKLMSMDSVMTSNNLILCHPLLLPPSIFPSNRAFSNESVLRIT